MASLSDADRARVLAPPRLTADLPGFEGAMRSRPEDFVVEEIPAYEAENEGDHTFLTMQKRGLNTRDAVRIVAKGLGIGHRDVGTAGLKDKHAVTRQRISVALPVAAVQERLAGFAHDAIELSDPVAHPRKLKTGHLHGNRFEITLRTEEPQALARTEAKLERLQRDGVLHVFGPQRFGTEARNVDDGLAILAGTTKRRPRKGDIVASAGQSVLFNLLVALRHEAGTLHTVLEGDILQKTDTRGLFWSDDVAADQARLDEHAVRLMGPIFGSKTLRPPEGSAARLFEDEVLARLGLDDRNLGALGKALPGSRRPYFVELREPSVRPAEPVDELGPGVTLCFGLPKGGYATNVLGEVMG